MLHPFCSKFCYCSAALDATAVHIIASLHFDALVWLLWCAIAILSKTDCSCATQVQCGLTTSSKAGNWVGTAWGRVSALFDCAPALRVLISSAVKMSQSSVEESAYFLVSTLTSYSKLLPIKVYRWYSTTWYDARCTLYTCICSISEINIMVLY